MKNKKIVLPAVIAIIFSIILLKKFSFDKNNNNIKTKETNLVTKPPSKLQGDRNKKYTSITEIKELFKNLNVEYSNHPRIHKECNFFKNMKKEDYLLYNSNKEQYDKLTDKYGSFIEEGYVAPVYIKWVSDEIGYGCFADEDIPKGTLIGEYTGDIIPKEKIAKKTWSWKYPSRGSFSAKFPKNISLNGFKYGNETRFINHNVNAELDLPNCEIKFVYSNGIWHLLYIAKRFINKDEEIFVDYGTKYWNKRKLL